MNHRAEWCAAFELRRCPGIPVTDGVHGAVEIDLVHLAGAIVGVGVVPKQASFLRHLGRGTVFDRLSERYRIDAQLVGCLETWDALKKLAKERRLGNWLEMSMISFNRWRRSTYIHEV